MYELTGARLPGLEIFFGLELESSEDEAESVEVPEGDYADWADNVENGDLEEFFTAGFGQLGIG